MISGDVVNYISSQMHLQQKELIEKDMLLQQLLRELSNDAFFKECFVFKGGTCLIKCYLEYYRFSEDLDFTYIHQNYFKNKSEKAIRRQLSDEITKLAKLLEKIAQKLSLLFKAEKMNKRYVEYGGSNKFVTFKIWYQSTITKREQFVKIQINFVEVIKYPFKQCKLRNLAENINKEELRFLFPEYASMVQEKLELHCYDLKEILLEKVRAMITRQAFKIRDVVDIYFITAYLNKEITDFRQEIIEKTVFMLKYEKYLKSGLNNPLPKDFSMEDVETILLQQLPKNFEQQSHKIIMTVQSIINEIKQTV